MKKFFILIASISLLLFISCGDDIQKQMFTPEIPVYKTETQRIPIYQEFVGEVYGLKDISIRARVVGYLEQIYFNEGTKVEKGKLLYRIESQLYEQDVAAKLSALAEAKTLLANAENELNRYKPLAEVNAISKSDLDAVQTNYDAALAGLEAAEANLRASQINLGYTKIYSPLTGIIGKTKAKVGDFVGQSPNPVILNVVSQIDQILVEFFLTENDYLKFARRYIEGKDEKGNKIKLEKQKPNLQLILTDGSIHEHKGVINFIDRGVDPLTGAVLIQASFPNPTGLIRPGQFAKVKALVNYVEEGILIPQRCVSEIQGIFSVLILDEDNKIEKRRIEVGQKYSDFWLITDGLKANEMIVYEGIQKVREGMTIKPVVKEVKPLEPIE
ncbi:MAG: efflux RND transporter periplasmic adaptor subunit [Ignavibacteria bacterium]|nr:efflux RND transporter periplasmic adaptor subunit [Ignavibacteria bacterium]MBT8382055.1 efflux RND transporter periplasmic adaptor subunit [Ignavibacteria bacterium]MBT8392470.1 efflux RND transporter periplasmic adaptor subunit [Ignavibacteria bacterium]NNJ52052.1 efflux RND transporter periplasmic adaptor subunit [Ignavibacteriaceae bacterium]NNL19899.1 efflux RND transporter periplasmic adaptor subunit [Ignavibacteriaceae bacterium]